jgi:hypothetical protein
MLEARYHPLTEPDFRIFYKAQNIKYLGKLDVDSISDWALKKIGLPSNRIGGEQHLRDKLSKSSLIVTFISDMNEADREFKDFLQVTRQMIGLNDVEFAYLYPSDFGSNTGNLQRVLSSDFYRKWKFGIRVYRRGNISDVRDMELQDCQRDDEVAQIDMERFIYRNTFVGEGPDFIREANQDNMMTFFGQDIPGMFFLYSSQLVESADLMTVSALRSLTNVFDQISGKIVVVKVDVETMIGSKLAVILNVDEDDVYTRPNLRIINPGAKTDPNVKKYRPLGLSREDEITESVISKFVQDYIDDKLPIFLKT